MAPWLREDGAVGDDCEEMFGSTRQTFLGGGRPVWPEFILHSPAPRSGEWVLPPHCCPTKGAFVHWIVTPASKEKRHKGLSLHKLMGKRGADPLSGCI